MSLEVPVNFESVEVTDTVKKIAFQELGETEFVRRESLQNLKQLIKEDDQLNSNTSEVFLLQFLRARKFDSQAAFRLLKGYYQHRKKYQELYINYTPSKNKKVMKSNLMTFLASRTNKGSAIWAVKLGQWDPKFCTIDEFTRFGLLCHDKALTNPVTQICGIESIVDLEGLSWWNLMQIPSSSLRCYLDVIQECLPVRHKAVHIIHNASIFAFLFAMIKPFISAKIRDRIHFHGNNLENLHFCLDPSILPIEFGGAVENFQNERFYSLLLDSENQFTELSKFGYKT